MCDCLSVSILQLKEVVCGCIDVHLNDIAKIFNVTTRSLFGWFKDFKVDTDVVIAHFNLL